MLDAEDHALLERHRRGKNATDDEGVIPLCPPPAGHPWLSDKRRDPREVNAGHSPETKSEGLHPDAQK